MKMTRTTGDTVTRNSHDVGRREFDMMRNMLGMTGASFSDADVLAKAAEVRQAWVRKYAVAS